LSTFSLPDFPEDKDPLNGAFEDLSIIIERGKRNCNDMDFEQGSMNPIDYFALIKPCNVDMPHSGYGAYQDHNIGYP
jgi:hypothetical protein